MVVPVCDLTGARWIINNGHRGMPITGQTRRLSRSYLRAHVGYYVCSRCVYNMVSRTLKVDDDSAAAARKPRERGGKFVSYRIICSQLRPSRSVENVYPLISTPCMYNNVYIIINDVHIYNTVFCRIPEK